jgi:hypothetical protein
VTLLRAVTLEAALAFDRGRCFGDDRSLDASRFDDDARVVRLRSWLTHFTGEEADRSTHEAFSPCEIDVRSFEMFAHHPVSFLDIEARLVP